MRMTDFRRLRTAVRMDFRSIKHGFLGRTKEELKESIRLSSVPLFLLQKKKGQVNK